MEQQVARLEDWCVTPLQMSPYTPPECRAHGLHGTVFGHPSRNFFDGDEITTSEIVALRMDGDNVIVRTRNYTEYLLGQVDPEYEKAYPNARQRVIDAYSKRRV